MNTIVFNKLSGAVLFEDRGAPERERGGRPYGGVLDSAHARPEVGIPDGPPLKDNLSLRHRRTGARQNGGKVRHKRQALQDMARPLKQWLYKHRDNPYPTKTEKILLALGSQMTLVQVSNWFANARRRLKNTVRQPDLSWALRIKLYNKYVQGNAERLSVSSDDSCSEDGENPPRTHVNEGGYNTPVHHSVIKTESSVKVGVRPESRATEDYVSPPKYKSSLLNRYLNDSLRHVMATNTAMMGNTRQRNHSGSFSSNEFEEELVSPSSSETEGNFVYRTDADSQGLGSITADLKGCPSSLSPFAALGALGVLWPCPARVALQETSGRTSFIWKLECNNMAGVSEENRFCAEKFSRVVEIQMSNQGNDNTLEIGSSKGDSTANRKGPGKDDTYWKEINAAMALTNLAQGKDTVQGTTSRIIQKSSHIAEVKTVKVPLVQPF